MSQTSSDCQISASPLCPSSIRFEQQQTKLTKGKPVTAALRFLCDLLFRIRWFVWAWRGRTGQGGARSPLRAAPASHRTQPLPPRRQPLNRVFGLRPHPKLVKLQANQTFRHARGAHRVPRPAASAKTQPNRAQSSLIVLNRETSNRALCWPSAARCSHQAAPSLGLLCLRRVRLGGGHRRRPPSRLGTCRPTLFLDEADATRPHPFRQSLSYGVYPPTPARNKWSVVLWSHGPIPVMLQVVAPYVAEMLHLKLLTINVVTGVAGFLSISHLSHPIPWARIAAGRWRMETPKQCGSEATADQSPSKSE